MSLVRDAAKGLRQPRPGEQVARKAAAHTVASTMLATIDPGKLAGGGVNLAAVAAAASSIYAPRTTLTPDDIQAALIEQGISFQPPLGPGEPLHPYDGYGRPARLWQYTPGGNIAAQTRIGRIPFETLTMVFEGYDMAQICANHIIADITSMPLLFRAIEGYEKDASKAIAQAKQFLKLPDGKHPFRRWLGKYLYDQVAYDCAAIFKVKSKGGQLKALKLVDGRMLAPIIDYLGERPDAPAPAYLQFVQGIPWGWHDETQIVYEPFTQTTGDPRYGLPPIETILLNANTDVRFQWHFLNMFTGGQVPEGFMEAPPDQSDPDALAEWQELWDNYMYGDQTQRFGVRWVPVNSKFTPYKPTNFDDQFPLYLERKTIAAFNLTPVDLGLTETVNRATSDTQVDVQFRISTEPRTNCVEDILNPILQNDLGLPVECYFDTGREKEDRLMEAQTWSAYIASAIASPDEARDALGLENDPANPFPRGFVNPRLGFMPAEYAFSVGGEIDPGTYLPKPGTVQPTKFVLPGALAPDPNAPTPGHPAPPALGPGQPPGQPGGQNPPPNPPKPAPTSPVAKPPGGQEPVTEMTVEAPGATEKPPGKAAKAVVDTAGLAVRALDTGRVLMMQRDEDAKNAPGTWEFPGGVNDDDDAEDDASLQGTARREWSEEMGQPVPAGTISGSWTSGNYKGFILDIEHEADLHLDPKKRDKNEVAQAQWVSPETAAKLPNLRPELKAAAPWGKLAKCETAGVTSATGLTGVNLVGDDDDDDDDEEVQKVLAQWQSHAMLAVRRGRKPRYFADPVLPVELARSVYKALGNAKTRGDVAAVFKAVKADPKASRWPGHRLRGEIPKAYASKLSDALRAGTKGIDAAVASMVTGASKASEPPDPKADAAAAVQANVTIDPQAASDTFARMYADAYAAGANVARNALGTNAMVPRWLEGDQLTQVSRDWDNWQPGWGDAALQDAQGGLKTLLDARGITIQGITNSAIDRLGDTLATGIANGDAPATIAAAMSDAIADPDRAFMIADTETARAMTAASIDTYNENGVEQVDILTFDPCDECEELEDANPYDLDDAPDVPIHPQCFPAGTITAGPRVVGSVERWYDGELVEIVTALGDELSVTPNHPVLTDKGWVAAGLLNVGSNVIRCPAVERVVAIHPDDYHGPALIEDVAETLGGAFRVVARSVPVATVDFHSDGGGSDVCVVRTDGLLGNDAVHATVAEPLGHREFEFACHMADTFDAERLVGQTSVGELRPSDRVVGSLSPLAPFIGSGTGHADEHGSRAVAGSDSSVGEPPPDAVAVDTEGTRQRKFALAGKVAAHDGGDVQVSKLRAGPKPVPSEDSVDARFPDADNGRNLIGSLAGLVESDRVIDLRRVKWSGHVYNLETESGWYMANSLVVHNCRCALAPSNIPGAPSAEEGE